MAAPNNGGRNPGWRAERYPIDFPAFVGRDLSSDETVEPGNDLSICNPLSLQPSASIFPNPASDILIVESYHGAYQLTNLDGKVVAKGYCFSAERIDLSSLKGGMYILTLEEKSFKVILR